MHEMALMGDILRIVTQDAENRGLHSICSITLLVGEYSNAMPDALEMALLVYREHTPFLESDCELHIILEAGSAQCVICDTIYKPDRRLSICPLCGMPSGKLIAGEAFQVLSYEGS